MKKDNTSLFLSEDIKSNSGPRAAEHLRNFTAHGSLRNHAPVLSISTNARFDLFGWVPVCVYIRR